MAPGKLALCVSGGVKGLSGLMSQYAHDSDSEETDEDIDTSMYNVEAGKFCTVVELVLVCFNDNIHGLAQVYMCNKLHRPADTEAR